MAMAALPLFCPSSSPRFAIAAPPPPLHSQALRLRSLLPPLASAPSGVPLAAARSQPPAESAPYVPGPLDDVFQALFRKKMVEEVGWDSKKPGYDGLIEVARHLLSKNKSKSDTEQATVRILRSLFPPFLLPLFRILVAPLFGGKPAAILTAKVTQATCQWLMGRCVVNHIELPDGSSMESGVLVERCKYLEESKCAGICIHTCKLPTQLFIKHYMGIPLSMEPNFEDFSCQFKFGVEALPAQDDETLQTPCLEVCPIAAARTNYGGPLESQQCPQVTKHR